MGFKNICALDGCEKEVAVVRDQLCAAHYAQVQRYGYDEPVLDARAKDQDCKAPWCDRKISRQRELCIPCYKRRTRYGLSVEDYISLVWECEVCLTKDNLRLDHCHDGGHFRGVLCNNCNTALGFLEENQDRIIALAEYAKRVNNVVN
jgi:hypothetical protein